jgi:diguanylate cyclase (GGDEF)-like protein/PAS domain S-box-containing protein
MLSPSPQLAPDLIPAAGRPSRPAAVLARVRDFLPAGGIVAEESWRHRHRVILTILWFHVAVLWLFGALMGRGVVQCATAAGLVAAAAALASWPQRSMRFRAVLASLGLLTASSGLVHLSGGYIELHFHFFVMVAVIALYHDWAPFLAAIGLVVFEHGAGGLIAPESVYNHAAAQAHPWLWAGIHGSFVLGISAACLVNWRLNEIEYQRRIQEQHRAEQVVRDSEAYFRSLVQNAADIISVLNADGSVRYASPSYRRLLGYGATDAIAGSAFDRIPVDERPKFETVFSELVAHPDTTRTLEVRMTRRDGNVRTLDVIATNRLHDSAIQGVVINARDITDRKVLEEQLIHQAFHDPLTGLPNRALFMDRLAHALARSNRSADDLALLYLDFDQFKAINDTLGHTVGDQFLIAMGKRLCACVRSGDTVARLGGDEYAILLEESDSAVALDLAERIAARFRTPFQVDSRDIIGTVSIGIAVKTSPNDRADDLVRQADIAMYAAKRRGKGGAAVYEPAMHDAGLERLQLEAEIQHAIERNEFHVVYQPIIDLVNGELNEVEALVRWDHPTRGLLLPGAFIPQAEESGLIVPLGLWVLREACKQVRAWQLTASVDPPLTVSVNLSPRMFQHAGLVNSVSEVLRDTCIDPHTLRLEITEGVLMDDRAAAARTMAELKTLGVQLVMDDFGTGYSSLSSLQSFPFDVLKIDQSFTRALKAGGESVAIVQAIIDLAASLDLRVTSEGIETPEQLDLLRALGSDHGQGYLFSKPRRAEELTAMIAERRVAPKLAARTGDLAPALTGAK